MEELILEEELKKFEIDFKRKEVRYKDFTEDVDSVNFQDLTEEERLTLKNIYNFIDSLYKNYKHLKTT